jgi:TolB-like protein/Tfp pilus assembly protein PilF
VLPFANMSGDPQQDYFADGMTDDLITGLSQVSGLFVIARNSSFSYKGQSVDVRKVAETLGVRYVLEGSVQRASDRVRINAQLIDAVSGGHVWAEHFDGKFSDVFALQDKVTRDIADALALRLTQAEQQALAQQETSVPAAYDAFLRGWEHYRLTTPDDLAKAIPFFEEAVRLDPSYGRAYAALALVYVRLYSRGWTFALGITRQEARTAARDHLQKAKELSATLAHQVDGIMMFNENRFKAAIAAFQEGAAAEPGDPWNHALLGLVLTAAGRPAEALQHIQVALRLDPHPRLSSCTGSVMHNSRSIDWKTPPRRWKQPRG